MVNLNNLSSFYFRAIIFRAPEKLYFSRTINFRAANNFQIFLPNQTYVYFGILYGHFIGILSKDLYLLKIPKKKLYSRTFNFCAPICAKMLREN